MWETELKLLNSLLACTAVLALVAPATAQTAARATDQTTREPDSSSSSDVIVVYGHAEQATTAATGFDLTPRETPQSVTAITQQQIEDQGLTSVTDVLAFSTGISSKAIDRGRNTLSARGFEITNFQIDGAPFATGNVGFDETSTAIYERVEIVRGATGLLNGAGDPSASVNLVRKHADSSVFTGNLSLEAGTWDRFAATADISTPITSDGSVRARFIAQAYEQESFVDLESTKGYLLYAVVDADLGPNTRLSAGASYQSDERDGVLWGQLPYWFSDGSHTNWDRSKTTGTEWNAWDTSNQNAFVMVEHDLGAGWSLRGDVGYHRQVENSKLLFTWDLPDPVTGEGMQAWSYWYEAKPEQWNVSMMATGPFTLFNREHELVAGVMYNHLSDGWTNRDPLNEVGVVGNFFEWDGSYPEPDWGPRYDMSGFGETEQYAAYAAGRFQVLDNLTFIAGGRLSNWTRIEQVALYTPAAYTIEHEGVFTPYAGLVWDLTDSLSAYGSYTSIFRPQTNRDRNGAYLDPLEGDSYEAGIKGDFFGDRLFASAAIFRVEQNNFPVIDDGFFIPGTTDPAWRPAQGTVAEGYEIELSGKLTSSWDVNLGWTDYTAEDADGLDVVAHHPRQMLKLATVYDLGDVIGGLRIGGALRWESRPPQNAINPGTLLEERVGQPAYAILNLMAEYAVNEQVSLQLNVNNVLDETYFNNNQWFAGYVYGEPLNAHLTLDYAF